jgi:hypothetical protein
MLAELPHTAREASPCNRPKYRGVSRLRAGIRGDLGGPAPRTAASTSSPATPPLTPLVGCFALSLQPDTGCCGCLLASWLRERAVLVWLDRIITLDWYLHRRLLDCPRVFPLLRDLDGEHVLLWVLRYTHLGLELADDALEAAAVGPGGEMPGAHLRSRADEILREQRGTLLRLAGPAPPAAAPTAAAS